MVRRVYKGIPQQLRGKIWSLLLDVEKVKNENAVKYEVSTATHTRKHTHTHTHTHKSKVPIPNTLTKQSHRAMSCLPSVTLLSACRSSALPPIFTRSLQALLLCYLHLHPHYIL